MSRFALVLSLSFFLGVAAVPCSAAVTYEFVNDAAGQQDGYTINGTITFDSACGTACTNANILGYSFTFDNGSGMAGTSGAINYVKGVDTFTGSYGMQGDTSVLDVSATGITFDYTEKAGANLLRLGDGGNSNPSIVFRQGATATEQYGLLDASLVGAHLFNNVGVSGNPTIFTAVPEPSSFLALGLIGVVLGGRKYFGRGRKLVG